MNSEFGNPLPCSERSSSLIDIRDKTPCFDCQRSPRLQSRIQASLAGLSELHALREKHRAMVEAAKLQSIQRRRRSVDCLVSFNEPPVSKPHSYEYRTKRHSEDFQNSSDVDSGCPSDEYFPSHSVSKLSFLTDSSCSSRPPDTNRYCHFRQTSSSSAGSLNQLNETSDFSSEENLPETLMTWLPKSKDPYSRPRIYSHYEGNVGHKSSIINNRRHSVQVPLQSEIDSKQASPHFIDSKYLHTSVTVDQDFLIQDKMPDGLGLSLSDEEKQRILINQHSKPFYKSKEKKWQNAINSVPVSDKFKWNSSFTSKEAVNLPKSSTQTFQQNNSFAQKDMAKLAILWKTRSLDTIHQNSVFKNCLPNQFPSRTQKTIQEECLIRKANYNLKNSPIQHANRQTNRHSSHTLAPASDKQVQWTQEFELKQRIKETHL